MTVKEMVEKSGKSKSSVSRMLLKHYPEYCGRQRKMIEVPDDIGAIVIARLVNGEKNMDIDIPSASQFPNGNNAGGKGIKIDIEAVIERTVNTTLKMVMPLIQDYVTEITQKTTMVIRQEMRMLPREIKALDAPAVRLTDLPVQLARAAEAAINGKIKSDERKARRDKAIPNLF